MIHPATMVKYINLTKQKEDDITIQKLWSIVSTNRSDRVMLQDNYGWTELLDMGMIKVFEDANPWMEIITEDHLSVYLSQHGVIPVYDPETTKPGFHGRVLYGYHLIRVSDVKPGDVVRLLPGKADEQFQAIRSVDKVVDPEIDVKVGFQVVTKSGLFAGNSIQLNGCKDNDSNLHWD